MQTHIDQRWIPLTQRAVIQSFDFIFDVGLYKPLNKQSNGRWFETTWRPWDVAVMFYHFSTLRLCRLLKSLVMEDNNRIYQVYSMPRLLLTWRRKGTEHWQHWYWPSYHRILLFQRQDGEQIHWEMMVISSKFLPIRSSITLSMNPEW